MSKTPWQNDDGFDQTPFEDRNERSRQMGYDHRASNKPEEPSLPPVEIPAEALSKQALNGLIDSFISREGTDYGSVEVSHDTKVVQIQKQILSKEIVIVFDPSSESATLLTKKQWERLQS